MQSRRQSLWGIAGLLLLLAASQVRATDPIPMPCPIFSSPQLDGTTLSSKQLPSQDKWLVVFTMADCPGCDNFLRVIKKQELPDVPAHVVVVVSGATAAKAKDLAAKFPDLAEAAWYADPAKNGAKQLKLPGIPAVFGVNGTTVQWCILGVLSGDTAKMKSVLTSWVNPNNKK